MKMENKIIEFSHNDYWCNNPIHDAMDKNIHMFEVDVVLFRGAVMLAHSWRPWRSAYYGSLEQVYLKPLKNNSNEIYLYVELKSGRKKLGVKLFELMKKYKKNNLIFVLGAEDQNWFTRTFQRREKLLEWILYKYEYELDLIWINHMKTKSM